VGSLKEFDERGPADAGYYPFSATLEDGSTGLYRLEPDGKISVLLTSDTKTELSAITRIVVYTKGKSPEETRSEILDRINSPKPASSVGDP
jgi:hypothetical protein